MSDEKQITLAGVEYKFSTAWIHTLESEMHWRLYWRQQRLMEQRVKAGHRVLEIGVGSGFTANYLRAKRVQVTTFDIDEGKSPDVVGNIVEYDFQESFDHVLAFEVFEHIPFAHFEAILGKLANCCSYCFISVPRNRKRTFKLAWKLPRMRERIVEWWRLKKQITEKHHFWEIDHGETTMTRVESVFDSAGFDIIERQIFRGVVFFAVKSRQSSENG